MALSRFGWVTSLISTLHALIAWAFAPVAYAVEFALEAAFPSKSVRDQSWFGALRTDSALDEQSRVVRLRDYQARRIERTPEDRFRAAPLGGGLGFAAAV